MHKAIKVILCNVIMISSAVSELIQNLSPFANTFPLLFNIFLLYCITTNRTGHCNCPFNACI